MKNTLVSTLCLAPSRSGSDVRDAFRIQTRRFPVVYLAQEYPPVIFSLILSDDKAFCRGFLSASQRSRAWRAFSVRL
jgi:hypothetical protein